MRTIVSMNLVSFNMDSVCCTHNESVPTSQKLSSNKIMCILLMLLTLCWAPSLSAAQAQNNWASANNTGCLGYMQK